MCDRITPRASGTRFVFLLLGALFWAASWDFPDLCLRAPESMAQNCPDGDSPAALQQIMEDLETYIGCRIVAQGTLYRMQSVHQIVYSLKLESGQSLDVWPWAPDEGTASQKAQDPAENDRTMPSYVGQELRIEGRLVQPRRGEVVLEASIIEEIKGVLE
jgi:hypothetical protein